eukprot:CAMPEP_0113943398 /NCGR_PEP_ID=MMETSP1339-20121228/23230_1 /TAXON_ID=94617 /ORGANISM="Fibrocapsa japonica" /LENGTH=154 /DNA_ID=CAMNT_0000948255 /DNA_START=304 /DNA_END=768 /DNA_ORIENTATION=- /assembly_acc=CAM_ASM_000762
MGSLMSMEALFWAPLGMDLLLLVTTYSCCRFYGLKWYLKTINQHSSDPKKNDDVDGATDQIADKSNPIHSVWDLAMIAYSAYGCLLPWAAYVCYIDPSHRTSCAWAMTALMLHKLMSEGAWNWTDEEQRSKIITLIVFYLPTYGGYAVYNTFLK